MCLYPRLKGHRPGKGCACKYARSACMFRPTLRLTTFGTACGYVPPGHKCPRRLCSTFPLLHFYRLFFFFKFKLAVEVYSIRGYVCTIFKERIRPNPNMHSQSTIRQPVYSFNDSVTNSRVPMHCSLRPLLSFVESNYDRRISWCCDNWMLLWAAFTDWHRPQLRGPDEVLR